MTTPYTIPGYDAWKLASPDDDSDGIGTEEGQPCNRVAEPDDDAPRGYRPKPCKGVMRACENCGGAGVVLVIKLYPQGHHERVDDCTACGGEAYIACDTCGEEA